jgi:hypothetical protein
VDACVASKGMRWCWPAAGRGVSGRPSGLGRSRCEDRAWTIRGGRSPKQMRSHNKTPGARALDRSIWILQGPLSVVLVVLALLDSLDRSIWDLGFAYVFTLSSKDPR